MEEERFSPGETRLIAPLRKSLPPTIIVIALTGYVLLNLGCVLLITDSLILGIVATVGVNLLVFLVLRPRWVVPLYVLIAGPSVSFPLGASGITSRLYVGILLLPLLVVIGCVRRIAFQSKSKSGSPPITHSPNGVGVGVRDPLLPTSLMIPLVAMVFVGLTSIIFAGLQPDPKVSYSFQHADIPLILINAVEMSLLLGLPLLLLALPGLIRTMRDIEWIVRALIGVGLLYALGTIFAGPLGLNSQEVILGYARPQVFGQVSSALGLLLVLFTCIALGKGLYAPTLKLSLCWYAMVALFCIATILSFGRESWISLFLSVLIMIIFRTRSVAILLVIFAFLLFLLTPGGLDFFNPGKVYGFDRLTMWQDAFNIWQQHPFFGVGAGYYQFFDITYGTDVGGFAHNQLLEVLAEMGIQGLFCLLWSIAAIGRFAFRRFQAARTSQGKAITLAYIGCYVALVLGLFFGDSFFPSVALAGGTYPLIWISYFWLPLALVLTVPLWEKSVFEQDKIFLATATPLVTEKVAITYNSDRGGHQEGSQAVAGSRHRSVPPTTLSRLASLRQDDQRRNRL